MNFFDKGWNVKSLNNSFKEVVTFRFSDETNEKRPTSQCAFSCVASSDTVQYEHIKRYIGCVCVCFKFPGVCFCQKLAESDENLTDISQK